MFIEFHVHMSFLGCCCTHMGCSWYACSLSKIDVSSTGICQKQMHAKTLLRHQMYESMIVLYSSLVFHLPFMEAIINMTACSCQKQP